MTTALPGLVYTQQQLPPAYRKMHGDVHGRLADVSIAFSLPSGRPSRKAADSRRNIGSSCKTARSVGWHAMEQHAWTRTDVRSRLPATVATSPGGNRRTWPCYGQRSSPLQAGLSATIAHEINNPLDAVMNLLYICQQVTENIEQQGHLEQAQRQLDRVARITRQTLQFSRTREARTSCKASSLVEDITLLLQHKLENNCIRVEVETRSDPEFYCYPGEFQQVLTNVLSNAIDAMSGPGRLRIRISKSLDWKIRDRTGVRITVGDTGSGMSPDILQYIMEPFFTTKGETGTGLGMWVTQDLMNKLGGTISINSSTNPRRHGTVVSLFVST